MKRFLVVLALTVVLLGVMLYFAPKPFENLIGNFAPNSSVFVYCRQTSLNAINMGNGFLVECSVETLPRTLQMCSQVDGISVKIAGNEQTFCTLLKRLQMEVCSVQQLGNLQVVCGRSSKISGGIVLDGKSVNLQMAFDGNTITLGSPLILDSY